MGGGYSPMKAEKTTKLQYRNGSNIKILDFWDFVNN